MTGTATNESARTIPFAFARWLWRSCNFWLFATFRLKLTSMPNETSVTTSATTDAIWEISPNADGPSRSATTLFLTRPVKARTTCITAYWLRIEKMPASGCSPSGANTGTGVGRACSPEAGGGATALGASLVTQRAATSVAASPRTIGIGCRFFQERTPAGHPWANDGTSPWLEPWHGRALGP